MSSIILETLPEVRSLSAEEKMVLTQELLDELHAPVASEKRDQAILEVLDARYEALREDPSTAEPWENVRRRLQERTQAPWRQ